MEKQTFKQFLTSREQLLEATKKTPIVHTQYDVTKYGALPVEVIEGNSLRVAPKQVVVVEWLYENVDDPTPLSVRLKGSKHTSEDSKHVPQATGRQLTKWLIRHTTRRDF